MSWHQRPVPKFSLVLPIGCSVELHQRSMHDETGFREWTGIVPVHSWWKFPKRIPSAPWARISRISKRTYRWSVSMDGRPWRYMDVAVSGRATTYCAAMEACHAARARKRR